MRKSLSNSPDVRDKRFLFAFFGQKKTLGKTAGIAITENAQTLASYY